MIVYLNTVWFLFTPYYIYWVMIPFSIIITLIWSFTACVDNKTHKPPALQQWLTKICANWCEWINYNSLFHNNCKPSSVNRKYKNCCKYMATYVQKVKLNKFSITKLSYMSNRTKIRKYDESWIIHVRDVQRVQVYNNCLFL